MRVSRVALATVALLSLVEGRALADDCFPDCREGYVCQGGTCVESQACFPACREGYVCRQETCVEARPDKPAPAASPDDPEVASSADPEPATRVTPADRGAGSGGEVSREGATNPQKTRFGVKAMMTTARFARSGPLGDAYSNHPDRSQSFQLGGAVGGFIQIRAGDRLVIQPELLVVMKGEQEQHRDSPAGESHTTMTYVELPLLAALRFAAQSGRAFSVFAGPGISYLVAASYEFTSSGGEGTQSIDFRDSVNALDLVVHAGAAFEIPMSTGALVVELRYARGLLDVEKDQRDFTLANSVIALGAGYRF